MQLYQTLPLIINRCLGKLKLKVLVIPIKYINFETQYPFFFCYNGDSFKQYTLTKFSASISKQLKACLSISEHWRQQCKAGYIYGDIVNFIIETDNEYAKNDNTIFVRTCKCSMYPRY
jgi:hypothetical protein